MQKSNNKKLALCLSCCGKNGNSGVSLGCLLFFPGFWVSLCLPFQNFLKATHLLLLSMHNWGKRQDVTFVNLPLGEEGKWRNHQKGDLVWWTRGLARGRFCRDRHTSADVPRCHSTSTDEWITQQMFNVKAELSRQENTHKRIQYRPRKEKRTHTVYYQMSGCTRSQT